VKDANGQALAYVYARENESRSSTAKGAYGVERLTSTYSVGVIHIGSSCGQPGEENSNIAANNWFMVEFPRCATSQI
jgi:hypothetical protein